MKMRWIGLPCGLILASLAMTWLAYAAPVKPVEDQPAELTAQDLASIMQLHIIKRTIAFPEGFSTVYFWQEIWHKGKAEPEVQLLGGLSGPFGQKTTILIKVPTHENPDIFFQLAGSGSSVKLTNLTEATFGYYSNFAEVEIKPEQNIRIAAVFSADAKRPPIIDLGDVPNPASDVTYDYGMRIVPGDKLGTKVAAKWFKGQVVLEPETKQ